MSVQRSGQHMQTQSNGLWEQDSVGLPTSLSQDRRAWDTPFHLQPRGWKTSEEPHYWHPPCRNLLRRVVHRNKCSTRLQIHFLATNRIEFLKSDWSPMNNGQSIRHWIFDSHPQ